MHERGFLYGNRDLAEYDATGVCEYGTGGTYWVGRCWSVGAELPGQEAIGDGGGGEYQV